MRPTLDIIIVNFNAGEALLNCLSSIPAALDPSFSLNSVVVVDNASSDGSLEPLDQLDLPLTFLRNQKNMGFGAACMQGACAGSSDYLLFLNPDTLLSADSLKAPLSVFLDGKHPDVGLCSIRLVDEHGDTQRSCARFPTPLHFILRAFYIGRLFPGPKTTHFMLEWDHAQTREVDHLMGAFLMTPRSLFLALGGFDPRFIVYLEDMDLSLRAHQRGYKSLFLAEATAFHKGGGTSEKVKPLRLFFSLQSRIRYAYKHFSRPAAIAVAFFALVPEFITRLLFALVRLKPGEALQTIKGYGRLYAWCLGRQKA